MSSTPVRSSARGNYERLIELLRREPATGPILDCPCGQGALAARLLAAGFTDLVVADYEPAKYVLPSPDAVFADLNARLPWADGRFAVVICCDGMSDIGFQRHAIAEFARILQPGGRLLISLPNVLNLRSRLRFLCTGFLNKFRHPLDELRGQSTTRPVPWWELRYMLVREGFDVEVLTCNRIKPAELLAAPLALFSVLASLARGAARVLGARQPPHVAQVHGELASAAVLFGESLIVAARRRS